jgi:hypothetical protein
VQQQLASVLLLSQPPLLSPPLLPLLLLLLVELRLWLQQLVRSLLDTVLLQSQLSQPLLHPGHVHLCQVSCRKLGSP